MTRDDLKTITVLTDEQLALLTIVDLSAKVDGLTQDSLKTISALPPDQLSRLTCIELDALHKTMAERDAAIAASACADAVSAATKPLQEQVDKLTVERDELKQQIEYAVIGRRDAIEAREAAEKHRDEVLSLYDKDIREAARQATIANAKLAMAEAEARAEAAKKLLAEIGEA